MKAPTELSWLFLDLNSYFASVEQQEDPRLRGRPVAVVPVADTDYTSAIAASKEAKAYGIKTGTMIADAKRMCPKLICVPAHHERYVTYHHRVLEEVVRHVPITKVWSIDELSSRLPPRFKNYSEAVAVAQRIKDGLRKNLGECITCSIGIAPNGYLGKIASDMQKPDGLVVLEPNRLAEKLFKIKLRDMPGIGHNMEIRLRNAGITTIADLWNASPKQARQAWGSVEGERMWYRLHGYDFEEQETNASVIGHSRVLDPELRNPAAARLVMRRLVIKAASRLRRKEFHASLFDISVRTTDDVKWAAQAQLQAAQDNMAFLDAMDQLWAAMMAELKPRAIRKVSIAMHGLQRNGEITDDLFAFASASQQKATRRSETLSNLMDKINEKYGAESIRLGPSPQTSAGYVGTKIAFSRIPDIEEFHE